MSVQPSPPARSRGGRDARKAERAKIATGPAYITRKIPTYQMLSDEGLAQFDLHADRILKEIGIEFRGDAEALELFRKAGADVKGERVRFEPGHVRALCKTAPEVFTQHARNPARSVQIGGKATVFSPSYGSPFVSDLEGGRRYGSLTDFENFIKLAYISPWLHHSGGTVCEPVEIPVNKRHLDMVYAHMRWSDKAFMGSVTAPERARDSVEMCRILFGADFVDKNCVILGNVNVNSPLVWDGMMTGAIRAYAEANQCSVIVPFILGGAMGPVTTAGALAQAYAEAMVGIALTQLVRPGAPAIFGNFLSSMSLRSGAPTFGMPEPSLAYFAFGALARRSKRSSAARCIAWMTSRSRCVRRFRHPTPATSRYSAGSSSGLRSFRASPVSLDVLIPHCRIALREDFAGGSGWRFACRGGGAVGG